MCICGSLEEKAQPAFLGLNHVGNSSASDRSFAAMLNRTSTILASRSTGMTALVMVLTKPIRASANPLSRRKSPSSLSRRSLKMFSVS